MDFLEISRRMIGTGDEPLFTPEDMQAIRNRMEEIRPASATAPAR